MLVQPFARGCSSSLFRLSHVCDNISALLGDIVIYSGHAVTIAVETIQKPKPVLEEEWISDFQRVIGYGRSDEYGDDDPLTDCD